MNNPVFTFFIFYLIREIYFIFVTNKFPSSISASIAVGVFKSGNACCKDTCKGTLKYDQKKHKSECFESRAHRQLR